MNTIDTVFTPQGAPNPPVRVDPPSSWDRARGTEGGAMPPSPSPNTPHKRVLVLGDGMEDVYWCGEVRGVSAEAPIPIITGCKRLFFPGGAENVVRQLRRLGGLEVVEGYAPPYPIKNRLMVGDTQVARWDERDWCRPISPQTWLEECWDGIVVADYGKGSISKEVVDALWERTATNPTKLFVDTKQNPSIFPWRPDVTFFPNMKEWDEWVKWGVDTKVPKVVLKMGSSGVAGSGDIGEYLSWATKVVSVNGAGDTLMATYVWATLTGQQHPLRWANAAAAVVVEKPYTAVATVEEIKDVLRRVFGCIDG